MKSIIRIIICLLFLSSINKLDAQKTDKSYSLTLQANDKSVSEELVTQTVAIINKRLMAFGFEHPLIKIDKATAQIKIQIESKTGIELPAFLIESKGTIGFYETYSKESLYKLFKANKSILAFLNNLKTDTQNTSSISCISQDEIAVTNRELLNINTVKQCRFAWSQEPDNSKFCLYALKLTDDFNPILKSKDIMIMNISNDLASGHNKINIEFDQEATVKWAKLTARSLDKAIAITIDNNVFFAPILKSVIENGKCEITGNFTIQQLKLFSAIATNGELPVSFTILK